MILCLNCESENPEGIKFCGYCSNPLTIQCSECYSPNPAQFNFCGQCGAPVQSGQSGPDAERRQLTVVFCDLKDSTKLSGELDPEVLTETLTEYREACNPVIERYQGRVAKYLGDGLMIVFGYPQAHDDDPRRAVRAALGIVEAIPRLNVQLKEKFNINLRVRIGIDTGLVVVGNIGRGKTLEEMAVVGPPPNISSKIQELAPLDSIVVSNNTFRRIRGYFNYREMPLVELSGLPDPIRLYEITGETDVQPPFPPIESSRLTPLVGREEEMSLLGSQWEKVKEGEGQVVIISGEGGIGKSRLIHDFKEVLSSEPYVLMESKCTEFTQNSAFYPLIMLMQQSFRFEKDDSPQQKFDRLEATLIRYEVSSSDAIPLLASLLSLPPSKKYPLLNMTPQRQRQRTMEAMIEVLDQIGAHRPVALIIEDLQWADPSTLEFLNNLIEKGPHEGALTLLTHRPYFDSPWKDNKGLHHLTLDGLPDSRVKAMIDHFTGGNPMPPALLDEMIMKAGGNPLYTEEITKMVLESDAVVRTDEGYKVEFSAPLMEDVPSSLQGMLAARLDRLYAGSGGRAVREVAQLAATIGRRFQYDLLKTVWRATEARLQEGLERLVDAEILYQEGLVPEASFTFKHSMVRDAAYQSLLNRTRHIYHREIATALEDHFIPIIQQEPEFLAQHYTAAGLAESAIPYWHLAGHRAMERSAYVEALRHLDKGIELVEQIPETRERFEQEIVLHASYGTTLILTRGYSDPKVAETFGRAQDLCERLGETRPLYPILYGLWAYYLVIGDYDKSHEFGQQLLMLGEEQQDTSLLVVAHAAEGMTYFYMGDLETGRYHLERAIGMYDFREHESHALIYGQDPAVVSHSVLCWTLWLQGFPDQATRVRDEGIALARRRGHPHSLAHILAHGAALCQWLRDVEKGAELSNEAMELSRGQVFQYWRLAAGFTYGWTLYQQGRVDEAIDELTGDTLGYQGMGARPTVPHQYGLLADALGNADRIDNGLDYLDQALELIEQGAENYYEAELHRLKGELLLKKASPDEDLVEKCFHKSVEIARRQKTRSWELRSAMSLARLWKKQGKRKDARDVLAQVSAWFDEGFGATDLKDAKELLAELS